MDSLSRCPKLSAAEFFKDSPWLQIPENRCGEILVEPLYPRGGLLGGSSSIGAPKVSKLAALAAARKKKENDNPSGSTTQNATNSVVLLDKLSGKTTVTKTVDESQLKLKTSGSEPASFEKSAKSQDRKRPVRNPRSSTPSVQAEKSVSEPQVSEDPPAAPESVAATVAVLAASPSIFARTMFGSFEKNPKMPINISESSSFFLPSASNTELNPFAGPSPDDIVIKAQNSKGWTRKIREI